MAYDESVVEHVRGILKRRRGITEQKMFGGVAFMLHGNMVCGVIKKDIVLRLGADRAVKALQEPHIRKMDFTGRVIKTMVYVSPPGYQSEDQLRSWVELAFDYVKSLPPK
jgi:TfoX/Sxy family transcriptional regulator of competence genes